MEEKIEISDLVLEFVKEQIEGQSYMWETPKSYTPDNIPFISKDNLYLMLENFKNAYGIPQLSDAYNSLKYRYLEKGAKNKKLVQKLTHERERNSKLALRVRELELLLQNKELV